MLFRPRLWEPLKAPTIQLESVYKKRRAIANPKETIETLLEKGGHLVTSLKPTPSVGSFQAHA